MKRNRAERAVITDRGAAVTLETRAASNPFRVILDWLRFTVGLDAIVAACPSLPLDLDALALLTQRGRDQIRMTRAAELPESLNSRFVCSAAARWLCSICEALEVGPSDDRGMDFYSHRTALMCEGELVGWVLAGGDSWSQAAGVHFNLFGACMRRISPGQIHRLKVWIEEHGARITRADIALDIWEGCDIASVPLLWQSGEFDVRGKRPSQKEDGSWTSGHSRTFYVGNRATGKLLRVYEKGDEQFGPESDNPWVRWEVEFRDKHRVISPEVMTRPADFFAGAYPYLDKLLKGLQVEANETRIKTMSRVADATAEAAAFRVAKWVKRTASPALVAMLHYAGDLLDSFVRDEVGRVPGRLRGWSPSELSVAFGKAFRHFEPEPDVSLMAG